jgi:glycosyltransferase involved in cell wall biosynthesis
LIRISAVVPTFDRHQLLPLALQSILAQTSAPDEILVIDNGYDPVPQELVPSPARLIRIPAGVGFGGAMNAGVEAAANEYVSFLDDDDRWSPDYLEQVRAAISAHPARPDMVLAAKHREVDGVVSPYKMIPSLEGLRDKLLYTNPGIAAQNLTLARDFHLNVHPGFRTELHSSADRAYLIDAIDCGAEICLAPKAVAIKVMHPGEQMTDGPRILKVIRFSRIYWSSMGRLQRIDNARKVVYGLREMVARRFRRGTR